MDRDLAGIWSSVRKDGMDLRGPVEVAMVMMVLLVSGREWEA